MKNNISKRLKEQGHDIVWLRRQIPEPLGIISRHGADQVTLSLGVKIANVLDCTIFDLWPSLPQPRIAYDIKMTGPSFTKEGLDLYYASVAKLFGLQYRPGVSAEGNKGLADEFIVEPQSIWHKGKISELEKRIADENDDSYVDHWEEDEKEGLHEPERDWEDFRDGTAV